MGTLVLKNVFKRYDNSSVYAVQDYSLECFEREFVGILGPSGCGKTTTLRMVAGLEEITKGDIYIGGRRVNDVHPKDRHIGLAFEDYALYPPLTVYDNIAFNLRAKKTAENVIKKEIMRVAPLLKIEDLLDTMPSALSGGQKQRVNIARALIRKPEILLLDEPMSHLDGKMRQILRTEIKRLHKEINCTTVLVTHDQLEAMSLADRIAIMKDGELQQFDTPIEVYNNPVNEFVAGFIGEPPMNIINVKIIQHNGQLKFLFPESDIKISVPKKHYQFLDEGMEVKLGIRPNDIKIKEEGSNVQIDIFENLGDEQRISIHVGEDQYLTLITENRKDLAAGQDINIVFNAERTHIFDGTGKKISK
ncbi:ATP-binding cassette domain-containing protein [Iocasia frigidifontis]|uniref:ATP-binding cassette domain-containing protein n=1 Tax=Iocasia fonsfrigidae TaxID=2682810 RepID=A0A8A7KHI9_9FIRM|nr:ABC transporter ATP-binding protein [Iocasia fonsfrigidae]QTL99545.1 ATP-binding cassette domain-containing protein [Iocasia fonsfrigidae]